MLRRIDGACFQCFSNRIHDNRTLDRISWLARDNNAGAPGQRSANRFKRFTPHNNGMTHGKRLKALQIRGQPPGQLIVPAYDAVPRHRHQSGETRLHTAIGALIAGCGS